MDKYEWNKPQSLLFDSGRNKIGGRGCQFICKGKWSSIKGVDIGIVPVISANCKVREEGCRSMAKLKRPLEYIRCRIEVTGYYFMRGVAGDVDCDWDYKKEESEWFCKQW